MFSDLRSVEPEDLRSVEPDDVRGLYSDLRSVEPEDLRSVELIFFPVLGWELVLALGFGDFRSTNWTPLLNK